MSSGYISVSNTRDLVTLDPKYLDSWGWDRQTFARYLPVDKFDEADALEFSKIIVSGKIELSYYDDNNYQNSYIITADSVENLNEVFARLDAIKVKLVLW